MSHLFTKTTARDVNDYVARAEKGEFKRGQVINLQAEGKRVRFAGMRREGGPLTMWSLKVSGQKWAAAARAMTA